MKDIRTTTAVAKSFLESVNGSSNTRKEGHHNHHHKQQQKNNSCGVLIMWGFSGKSGNNILWEEGCKRQTRATIYNNPESIMAVLILKNETNTIHNDEQRNKRLAGTRVVHRQGSSSQTPPLKLQTFCERCCCFG